MEDLRPLLFQDAPWFPGLTEDTTDYWVLWRITKSPESAWWRGLLIAAAAFARDHGLLLQYRQAFAGIRTASMADSASVRKSRSSVTPIWEIAYELVVGLFLEHVLRWQFVRRDPPGYKRRVGDWEFITPSGRTMFIEVKAMLEPEVHGTRVFSHGVASDRVTAELRGAYKQLPRDSRSTMVVLAGNGFTTSLAHGVMSSDLFQTLYGRMQVTFKVMPYVGGSERLGPSFYDTFAHAGKHRRLGCAAGLHITGGADPGLVFYAIRNPYADPACQLAPEDFGDALQFWVDDSGHGQELGDVKAPERWKNIVARLRLNGS